MSLHGALWYLYLALIVLAFQQTTRFLTKFSVFSIFLGSLLLRYGITVPFDDDVNEIWTNFPIDDTAITNYYISLYCMYGFILLGAVLALWVYPRRPAEGPKQTNHGSHLPLFALAALLIGITVVGWIVVPWANLYANLAGILTASFDAAAYRQGRVAYGSITSYDQSGLSYVASVARFALMPFAMWMLYFCRREPIGRLLFLVAAATMLAVGLGSGQKMPALLVIIGYFVCRKLASDQRSTVSFRTVLAVLCIAVLIPFLYRIQYPGYSYQQVIDIAIFRLTGEYSRTAQLRFAFYPDAHDYLHGTGSFVVQRIARVFGQGTDEISPERYIPLVFLGPNYGGTWNTGFFAEAWADFGFPGVIFESLLAGLVVGWVAAWYESSEQGPLERGAYAAFCVATIQFAEVSLWTLFWSMGLVSGPALYIIVKHSGRLVARASPTIWPPTRSRALASTALDL